MPKRHGSERDANTGSPLPDADRITLDKYITPLRESLQVLKSLAPEMIEIIKLMAAAPAPLLQAMHVVHMALMKQVVELTKHVDRLAPYVASLQKMVVSMKDEVTVYCEQNAALAMRNRQLDSLSAQRLMVGAMRLAAQHYRAQRSGSAKYPTGQVFLVATACNDVVPLRATYPHLYRELVPLLTGLMRRKVRCTYGYEAEWDGDGGGLFSIFTAQDALHFTRDVQKALVEFTWNKEFDMIKEFAAVQDRSGHLLFHGPRIQMAISCGDVQMKHDLISGRCEYSGVPLVELYATLHLAREGEILLTQRFWEALHVGGGQGKPTRDSSTDFLKSLAFLTRNECVVVEGEAQLVRTAIPSELLGRRKLYVEDSDRGHPTIVRVSGDQWTTLDAPALKKKGHVEAPARDPAPLVKLIGNEPVHYGNEPMLYEQLQILFNSSAIHEDPRLLGVFPCFGMVLAAITAMRAKVDSLEQVCNEQAVARTIEEHERELKELEDRRQRAAIARRAAANGPITSLCEGKPFPEGEPESPEDIAAERPILDAFRSAFLKTESLSVRKPSKAGGFVARKLKKGSMDRRTSVPIPAYTPAMFEERKSIATLTACSADTIEPMTGQALKGPTPLTVEDVADDLLKGGDWSAGSWAAGCRKTTSRPPTAPSPEARKLAVNNQSFSSFSTITAASAIHPGVKGEEGRSRKITKSQSAGNIFANQRDGSPPGLTSLSRLTNPRDGSPPDLTSSSSR
mmetsp:Transcript_115887/g.201642  ORF Transcript_115887/g.201642 Transcript_115887/m.201642 type:complete len:739 (-) Transcript_115887:1450-3666(-)